MNGAIVKQLLDLPVEDRVDLISILQTSLRRHRHTGGNKVQDMLYYPVAYRDIIDIWKQFQNKLI